MVTLTVTSEGDVTLQRDVLEHLGLPGGGEIQLHLLPQGRAELRAGAPTHSWHRVYGMLRKHRRAGPPLTIDELNQVIASAGADAGKSGIDDK